MFLLKGNICYVWPRESVTRWIKFEYRFKWLSNIIILFSLYWTYICIHTFLFFCRCWVKIKQKYIFIYWFIQSWFKFSGKESIICLFSWIGGQEYHIVDIIFVENLVIDNAMASRLFPYYQCYSEKNSHDILLIIFKWCVSVFFVHTFYTP